MTTTETHLNETQVERELRFIDKHIDRLEDLKALHDERQRELDEDEPDEDRRHVIYREMTDLEIELVLLEACYDRKQKLEHY
jgi:hypothetical protein